MTCEYIREHVGCAPVGTRLRTTMSLSRAAVAVLVVLAALACQQVAQAAPSPFNLGHIFHNVVNKGSNIVKCVTKANVPVSVAMKASSCASNKNPYIFAGCAGIKNVGEATKVINCIGGS